MLDDLGHIGLAASSGKEALDLIRQQGSVDLVITDYAMPQMTGLQLAEAIKEEWPELRVIIATGFAEMEPGVATTLPKLAKPFTQRDLARELARIIQATRGSGRVLKFRPAKPAV
jgi:YesN/AraC family two-component response regulator